MAIHGDFMNHAHNNPYCISPSADSALGQTLKRLSCLLQRYLYLSTKEAKPQWLLISQFCRTNLGNEDGSEPNHPAWKACHPRSLGDFQNVTLSHLLPYTPELYVCMERVDAFAGL